MCGALFLRAFGKDLYAGKAKKLLEGTDMATVYKSVDFEPIQGKIKEREFEERDLFTALWLLFQNAVTTELAENDQWRNQFFTESSKPRIMYRESTRKKILDRVFALDERSQKKALNCDFSDYFDNVGILKLIRKICS
jgi:hypothetical protein